MAIGQGVHRTVSSSLLQLEAALRDKTQVEIPKGFKSIKEWASEWKVSKVHANHKLLDAVDSGLAQRQKFNRLSYYKLLLPKK